VGELHDLGTVRRDSVEADRWVGRGAIKVLADVRVREARLDGNVSIGGKLAASDLRGSGSLEFGGAVEVAGHLGLSGNLRASSTVHALDADLRGDSQVEGEIRVDRTLTARGRLGAASLAVGAVTLVGAASVPGETRAYSVSMRFTADSSLGPVTAKTVDLRARRPNLFDKVFGRDRAFTVARVEADAVALEGVDVQFVRSPAITLGRGAHVTEYEGTIVRRHPSSRVGFESRSPRPYGLSR